MRKAGRGRRHRHAAHFGRGGANDARWLRETRRDERLLAEMVRQAAERFRGRRLRTRRMGEFDLIARYFDAARAAQPAGRGRRLRAAAAAARHAAGGVDRPADRRPALPVDGGPAPPRAQGAGGEPERPGGLRRAAAGVHAGAGAAAGGRSLAGGFSPKACSRWPTCTAANWSAATPPAGRWPSTSRCSAKCRRARRCCARERGPATTCG
jgi:hypothetical protein